MKKLAGIILVLCLALVGCSDDATQPADGGADAVAEASVAEMGAEMGPQESGTPDAGVDAVLSDTGAPESAEVCPTACCIFRNA